MQFSQLTNRINGEGAAAWDLHEVAIKDAMAGKDVIVLSVGDPDFATPAAITQAAIAALKAGDTHYQQVAGRREVRQVIAQQFQSNHIPNINALTSTQNHWKWMIIVCPVFVL